jgi:hypothetical protein
MTVQRAYLDYLRLASWDDRQALKLSSKLRTTIPKWRQGFWLQYKGWYGDNSFYGIGEQNHKRHYIWRTAGDSTSVLYDISYHLLDIYATRLDVQVTIELPAEYLPFEVYRDQKNILKRGTSIIDSDTGSTIYFGSRVSDRFARLYTKEFDEGKFLRLEFEFKGDTARALHEKMRSGAGATDIFQHYLHSFGLVDYIIDWFDTGFDGDDLRIRIERDHNNNNKLKWLSSLSAAIVKMGNDHETGPTTKRLLRNWIETIDKSES